MRRIPLSVLITALALGFILPAILFAALMINELSASEREAANLRTARQAAAIARAVEPVVDDMSSTLRLVTTSPELAQGDLRAFHYRTQKAMVNFKTFVIVVDTEGRQLLNTRRQFGEELGKTSNLDALQRMFALKREVVTEGFFGSVSGEFVFNVMQPWRTTANRIAGAVIVTRNTADLLNSKDFELLPEGWSAAIVDGNSLVISSSNSGKYPVGKPLSGLNAKMLTNAESPLSYFRLSTGTKNKELAGYARVRGTNWTATTWGPAASTRMLLVSGWRTLLTGAAVLSLLSGLAVFLVVRQLKESIQDIATMARKIGAGQTVEPMPSLIAEVDEISRTIATASRARQHAQERIRMIMGELAHRTKNLMSVVTAMIRSTARQAGSVADVERDLTARIGGLAHSIDLLVARNWEGVSLQDLVERQLSTFAHKDSNLTINGAAISLKPEAVQYLGMALHELATNAAKYGALSRTDGRVKISWSINQHGESDEKADFINLEWAETGGPPVAKPISSGFGTQVTHTQVERAFGAKVALEWREGGIVWTMVAPLNALI